MAFRNFIYSTTEAALNNAMTAKTVTNDDIAFVNENGVMFIKTQGVKFPCGYSKAEADAKFVTSSYTDGRYLKLTGGTLSGSLTIGPNNTCSTKWSIDFSSLADDTISYSDSDVISYDIYTSNRVSISGVQKWMYAPNTWIVRGGRLVTYSNGSRPMFIKTEYDSAYIKKGDRLVIVGSCATLSGVVDRTKTPTDRIDSITTTVDSSGVYTETITFSVTHSNQSLPIFLYKQAYVKSITYMSLTLGNSLSLNTPHDSYLTYLYAYESGGYPHLRIQSHDVYIPTLLVGTISKNNSSDDYFLLGGGGTVARSKYLTSDVSYLPLTGGTLTGDLTLSDSCNINFKYSTTLIILKPEFASGYNITGGGLSLTTDCGIDGGYSGYCADGTESSNNNIPRTSFNIDYMGYNIWARQGSGSSAKNVAEATYDQSSAIVGKTIDPSDSDTYLEDYGFGFFGEYPSSDSFVGLTPTGVKLHGGSSSKILVSDGTMSTLKTVNGESLLGDGDVAHVFYFDEYNVLTTPTISSAIPATATNVSVGGMYFFAKINKFLALVTYNYSSTGYRQYFNIKDGCVVDSLGTAIASVPALDSKYPRNSYGKAPDIYICTGTSIAYFGTGSGSTATTLTKLYGSLASKDSLSFSELASKPTTLSGYGITDAVSTNGGTINGLLTVNNSTEDDPDIFISNGGYIQSENNSLKIYPATSDGYIEIAGSRCKVDIDGWVYCSALINGDTSNDAELYVYISGKRYKFNTTALLNSGLIEEE